jgi:hypothetical protein
MTSNRSRRRLDDERVCFSVHLQSGLVILLQFVTTSKIRQSYNHLQQNRWRTFRRPLGGCLKYIQCLLVAVNRIVVFLLHPTSY